MSLHVCEWAYLSEKAYERLHTLCLFTITCLFVLWLMFVCSVTNISIFWTKQLADQQPGDKVKDRHIISVPFTQQCYSWDCGLACVSMILRSVHISSRFLVMAHTHLHRLCLFCRICIWISHTPCCVSLISYSSSCLFDLIAHVAFEYIISHAVFYGPHGQSCVWWVLHRVFCLTQSRRH